MRFYLTTDTTTDDIWHKGWTDLHAEPGRQGIYLSAGPSDPNDGFEGDVALCMELPERVVDQYDVADPYRKQSGCRLALIPAAVLIQHGKPQIFATLYFDQPTAESSRRDLLSEIAELEG